MAQTYSISRQEDVLLCCKRRFHTAECLTQGMLHTIRPCRDSFEFLKKPQKSPCKQELAEYWRNEFDWRKAEAQLNSFKQYKLRVNGIDLHFIHERSHDPDAIPLIFSHGWPGSFVEAFKIIPLLTAGICLNLGTSRRDSIDLAYLSNHRLKSREPVPQGTKGRGWGGGGCLWNSSNR